MYSVKQLVSLFTDHFRKDEESNTYKLMQLFSDELQLLEETNNRIIEWRSIDNAEGKVLDLIGQNVVQPRGTATDEVYRIMLKTKIARNLADGTLNGLITAIAYVLGVEKQQVKVVELWELLNEPAAMAIEEIPLQTIYDANITTDQFEEILTSLVAGGVKLMLLASGLSDYLQYSSKPYAFITNPYICGRFRCARVEATTAASELEMSGTPYSFIESPRMTNRFNTERVDGVYVDATFELGADPYAFDNEIKVTNRFSTDRVDGTESAVDVESSVNVYGYEQRTRTTGKFRTGQRQGGNK
ncbi:hypothetical protein ACFSY7_02990 [Kurthia populi]|uniref:Uncharacterized protein n=1 Tax=Kurthia populi TaxID=1562132 RepID=A0ABW5XWV9_9BACL